MKSASSFGRPEELVASPENFPSTRIFFDDAKRKKSSPDCITEAVISLRPVAAWPVARRGKIRISILRAVVTRGKAFSGQIVSPSSLPSLLSLPLSRRYRWTSAPSAHMQRSIPAGESKVERIVREWCCAEWRPLTYFRVILYRARKMRIRCEIKRK